MDDATQGLTALLGWSTDFNGSAYNLAGSIAAALLGVALIFVVWALATKKGKCQELSDSLAGMCHIHPIIHHQQITVMKRIILILGLAASIGLMGTGSVHAQFVVHDPGHTLLNSTEWIANVKKWVTQINEMIDAQELRLGLQKIDQLKELKSLKELADLLDDVACLSSDYSFYLNVGSNYHCLKFLNFQRVTVNLSLSTDLLFKWPP